MLRRASRVIRDDQVEKIKEYVESIDSTSIKIRMIRNSVWPADSGSNPNISKILKKNLRCHKKYYTSGVLKEMMNKTSDLSLNHSICRQN